MRNTIAAIGILFLLALVLLLVISPLMEIDCDYTVQCCSSNSILDCMWQTSQDGYPACPTAYPYKADTSLSCTR